MLNNIKSLILEKKSYMEAANLILEDTSLDDSIVLDESPEEPEVDPVPEEQPEEVPAETPAEQPTEDPAEVTNLDPTASEIPSPADGNELPEPVAAPTGEPVSDDSVDLMTVEIDPVSNTVKDTIPVAPANAADAVAGEGEPAAQPVDQPVEPEAVPPVEATGDVENITSPEVPEENDANLMNDSLDDEPAEEGPKDESAVESDPDSVDLMSESISIDDTPADDPAAAEAPADAGVEDLGTGEEPKQDNAVTAAVKDKVEELETQDEPAADTGSASDGKEELMKKLSALTKSIEDAKALVMSKVQ